MSELFSCQHAHFSALGDDEAFEKLALTYGGLEFCKQPILLNCLTPI